MRLLLIDNHDSFTYNIVNILRQLKDCPFEIINYDDLNINDLSKFTHTIISPGPMKPEDFPLLNEVIEHSVKNRKPLLGICLGHQTICTHFGGKLYRLENVSHGRKTTIEITRDCPVFESIPKKNEVGLYHSWAISDHDFPDELEIVSKSNEIVMAVQHKELPIYGIQFHPESFLTPYGKEILNNFSKL